MGVQQTTLGNTGMTGSRLLLLLWIIRVDSRSLKAKWGKGRSESERIGDATLLALEMEKGLQTKKCRQLLEAEKGKERDSFLELPEGIPSC